MTDWKTHQRLPDAPDLAVPTDCDQGRPDAVPGRQARTSSIPAWKAHDMTYDSSMPAPRNGIFWPEKVDGIWEFYMPHVYSPGFDGMVTAMDYNFWVKFNGGAEEPATAPELRAEGHETYDYMYDQAYNGNRAPMLIANHFNKWNGNSFNPAADGLHAREVRPAGHLLRDLPGRHRLDGAAGPGGAADAAGPGLRRLPVP